MAPCHRAYQCGSIAGGAVMIDLNHIDELARRLSGLVPPSLREGREELQQNFKSVLQTGLSRLDLVTREEFDVQRAALLHTRETLDPRQRPAADLEAQLAAHAADGAAPAGPPAPPRHCPGMNLAIVHRRARSGVHAPAVRVEVHLGG